MLFKVYRRRPVSEIAKTLQMYKTYPNGATFT